MFEIERVFDTLLKGNIIMIVCLYPISLDKIILTIVIRNILKVIQPTI